MNTLSNIFNNIPIFWINLSDSIERRDKMIDQLKDYKYNYRIDAVDGRNTEEFKKNYNVMYKTEKNFNTSLIAVICSHIKAIKTGYDSNYEIICVIEDDANFELVKDYPFTLKDIVNKAPKNWDIIQLYYTQQLNPNMNNYLVSGLQILPRNINYSGTCYLINKTGSEKILSNVVCTDETRTFDFKIPLRDPEHLIFSQLNSYVINLPFLYYYDEKMTFDSYTNNANDMKKYCQIIQYDAKNSLINFYRNHLQKLV